MPRLTKNSLEAVLTHATLECLVTVEPPASGGTLPALRRSPLVGADFARPRDQGRETDL